MPNRIAIDDQPISATFFGEGRWLTDFITPDAIDIKELHQNLTEGITSLEDRIAALHNYVASQIRYTRFVKGRLSIEGKSSVQDDLWNLPSLTARVKVANCANKAFLMTSLLRQDMSSSQIHCVLGNLYNGKPGGHAWCVSSDTKINCGGQIVDIKDVKPGATVMTHNGTISRVQAALTRHYSGELLHIRRAYNPAFPLNITPEHPVLTPSGWRSAGSLLARKRRNGVVHYIGEPITRRIIDKQTWQKSISYHYKYYHRTFTYNIPINEDVLRLIGYYLAEGVLRSGKRLGRYTPDSTVIFYFNKDEKDYINDVRSLIYKYFQTQTRVYSFRKDNKAVRLETKSRGLYELLLEFGKGASNKQIPPWVLLLPTKKQIGLISGYLRGDGNLSTHGIKFSSASISLIEDIRTILMRFDILASLSCAKAEKRTRAKGYLGISKNHYILNIMGRFASQLACLLDIPFQHNPQSPQWTEPKIVFDTAFYPILSITKEEVRDMPVYNLAVFDSQSYIANGCAVHNCQVNLGGQDYIIEATRADVPALVLASSAERYEAVHLFNDETALAIEGRTVMEPMTKCFSTWLSDYLNWSYIEKQRSRT